MEKEQIEEITRKLLSEFKNLHDKAEKDIQTSQSNLITYKGAAEGAKLLYSKLLEAIESSEQNQKPKRVTKKKKPLSAVKSKAAK